MGLGQFSHFNNLVQMGLVTNWYGYEWVLDSMDMSLGKDMGFVTENEYNHPNGFGLFRRVWLLIVGMVMQMGVVIQMGYLQAMMSDLNHFSPFLPNI